MTRGRLSELGPKMLGHNEYQYRRRNDKRTRGECINCSAQAVAGTRRCEACRRKHNAEARNPR